MAIKPLPKVKIMSKYSYAQQVCIKKSGLLLQRTNALWRGCRIGVAVSGGVDSMTLLQAMRIRQSILPFPIEIMVLHLDPGFGASGMEILADWLCQAGIAAHIEKTDFGPRAHSPENRKNSPCFYCAWLRRKRLFDLCGQYRLTHLALGHNAEDLQTTFLLNLLRNATVRGMSGNESFFGGKLKLVRPLLLVEKKYIRQAARQWRLPVWQSGCPSAGRTARSDMQAAIDKICADVPQGRRSMLAALCRWQLQLDEAQTEASRCLPRSV